MALNAKVKKYGRICFISAKNSMSTLLPATITLLTSIVGYGALFGVYFFVFSKAGGSIRGLSLSAALWSLGMYNVFWATGTRNLFKDYSDNIKTGSVEILINKPLYYPFYLLFWRLGRNSVTLIMNIVASSAVVYLIIGPPVAHMTLMWLSQICLLFVVGTLLAGAVYTIVGLSAFWIEDAKPVMWIIDKSIMVLGGGYIPIALLPKGLRLFSEWSPFGAVNAFTQSFQTDFQARFPTLLLAQSLWLAALIVAVLILFNRARRKLSVNGG